MGRLVRLTRATVANANPAWSPLGDKIAFECFDHDWLKLLPDYRYHLPGDTGEVRNWPIHSYSIPGNILVMNADGTDQSLLFDASMLYEDIGRHGEPAYVKSPADLSLLSILAGMRRIHRITRR